jgi:hypothetical protein
VLIVHSCGVIIECLLMQRICPQNVREAALATEQRKAKESHQRWGASSMEDEAEEQGGSREEREWEIDDQDRPSVVIARQRVTELVGNRGEAGARLSKSMGCDVVADAAKSQARERKAVAQLLIEKSRLEAAMREVEKRIRRSESNIQQTQGRPAPQGVPGGGGGAGRRVGRGRRQQLAAAGQQVRRGEGRAAGAQK